MGRTWLGPYALHLPGGGPGLVCLEALKLVVLDRDFIKVPKNLIGLLGCK